MPIINSIAAFHPEMTAWRHDLHAHPELSMQEVRTSRVVREKLAAFGVDEIITGMATHGVVGVIRSGTSDRAIGLRADMDALPIHEETGLPHASRTPGVMHACGHDGHTAMLLGAAKYLAETRNFDGTVYLIFQPAEEFEKGADKMVKDGLFDRCPMQRIYGLHNWPETKAGTFFYRNGPTMAAVAFFDIVITGRGSHAAAPHHGIDSIVVSAQIINALQTIVSRSIEPSESGVVSIGSIAGGDAHNILPHRVVMKGTARWYRPGRRADRNRPASPGERHRRKLRRHSGSQIRSPRPGNDQRCRGDTARDRCRDIRRRRARRPGDAGAIDGRRGFRLHAECQARRLPDARWRPWQGRPFAASPEI